MATRRPLVLVNGVTSELPAGDVVVDPSGIAPGSANQVLQTNAGGTATEWRSNVVVPGTLSTAGIAVFASGVGISGTAQFGGTATVAGTATLQGAVTVAGAATFGGAVVVNTSGALTLPEGTTAERPAIPASGDIRFNTTLTQFEGYNGTAWGALGGGGGAVGSGTNAVFYENDTTVTGSYTITTGKNAMTAGPITVLSGVTVTVPSGSSWTVV
jgi:hypothetical protein